MKTAELYLPAPGVSTFRAPTVEVSFGARLSDLALSAREPSAQRRALPFESSSAERESRAPSAEFESRAPRPERRALPFESREPRVERPAQGSRAESSAPSRVQEPSAQRRDPSARRYRLRAECECRDPSESASAESRVSSAESRAACPRMVRLVAFIFRKSATKYWKARVGARRTNDRISTVFFVVNLRHALCSKDEASTNAYMGGGRMRRKFVWVG